MVIPKNSKFKDDILQEFHASPIGSLQEKKCVGYKVWKGNENTGVLSDL